MFVIFCFPTVDIFEYLQLLKDTISAPPTSLEQENRSFNDWQSAVHFLSIIRLCITLLFNQRYIMLVGKSLDCHDKIHWVWIIFTLWAVKWESAASWIRTYGNEHISAAAAPSLSGKDGGTALKVNTFHVKIMLPRKQSTPLTASGAEDRNMTSTDP